MSIKALIPDYALGLLTPEQEQEVEAFLESCESCQAELESYTTMFVAMVESLPQIEPEGNFKTLKQSVLFSDRDEMTTKSDTSVSSDIPVLQGLKAREDKSEDTNVIVGNILGTFLQRLFTSWRYQSLSIVLTFGLAVMSFFGWGQYKVHLNTVETQTLVTQWLSNSATKTIPLTSESGKALGSLITNPNQENALVVLSNPPAKSRIYQTWGEVNQQCLPLAMSENNIFEVSWQDKDINTIIISSEPLGGSERSTDIISKVSLF